MTDLDILEYVQIVKNAAKMSRGHGMKVDMIEESYFDGVERACVMIEQKIKRQIDVELANQAVEEMTI